jgi:hypothetical protein
VNISRSFLGLGIVVFSVSSTHLYAALPPSSVVPHDEAYYTKDVRNTQLIYTESNLQFARQAAEIEQLLQPLYEQSFGYQMDETLHVGLISKNNQIANGFSTPYPNNRQINYIGGVQQIDYFSATSWLKTLLYHETAHNYQINAKQSFISSHLHSVFGNGSIFLPWFITPNIMESSFMLEGNAVLNESWHGNGGRLYSGRFKAETLQQAKAGYLQPALVYNDNYNFLYGSHFYTLGGAYQYYLAQNYGLDKTNSYWMNHSRYWYLPFFTNFATERTFGVNFDTAFDGWRKQMIDEAGKMVDVDGDTFVTSQFFNPLNADEKEIYFIANETGRSFPELVVYDKASGKITKTRGSYNAGKVIKLADGRYVTQASANTSPWRIYQGLFDEGAFIVKGTQSKVVEGYLKDGSEVYFDVPSSYDQPQLYVGDKFYARVNSSVLIDKDDNLYYFVQGEEKNRTLYKNKQPLLTLKGYYSYVSGVDSKGAVYFIANTEHGSSLFKYDNGKVTRAHKADTIFDARIIDDHSALVAVVGSDAYSYKRIDLAEIDQAPYEVKLFVENEPNYRAADPSLHHTDIPALDTKDAYYSLLDMHYSGTSLSFANSTTEGFIYNIDVAFADPLTQNSFSIFALRNIDQYTLGGLSYTNSQYFLQYALTGYSVLARPNITPPLTDERNSGVIANAYLPFLESGHYRGQLRGGYFQDYESNTRKPLSAALDLSRSEGYGVAMYSDSLLAATPYVATDRGDRTTGGEAKIEHSLFNEFYVSLGGQTSSSDAASSFEARGVKLVNNQFAKIIDSDPTTVVMPGLKNSSYFKRVTKGSISLTKVLNYAMYNYKVPASLRRESVYTTFNNYTIEPFTPGADNVHVNEFILGTTLDMYFLHRIAIPVIFEYIYNDNNTLAETNKFIVRTTLQF